MQTDYYSGGRQVNVQTRVSASYTWSAHILVKDGEVEYSVTPLPGVTTQQGATLEAIAIAHQRHPPDA